MSEIRASIPPGEVSRIRGRWQAPALTWLTRVVIVVALAGGLIDNDVGSALAVAAIAVIVAAPLLRICWLMFRWTQEHDHRFVITGALMLTVVATGGVLAALGVGA